jgi:hypothetical protein
MSRATDASLWIAAPNFPLTTQTAQGGSDQWVQMERRLIFERTKTSVGHGLWFGRRFLSVLVRPSSGPKMASL